MSTIYREKSIRPPFAKSPVELHKKLTPYVKSPDASRMGKSKEEIEYTHVLNKLKREFEERWKYKTLIKTSMDDFERFRTLGTGAFGRVILIRHKETDTYYAMKVLDKVKIIKMRQVEHTLYEKRILQAIKYPFVVNMEYSFKDNSYLYFVLPFVNGGELFTYLRNVEKFSEPLAQFYGAQVCLGLEYLHYLDMVYRDLKPENILIDAQGYLKITDLGFCKIIKGRTWTLCGTPEYLAPEIILSKGYGKTVDWWSYGVLLFEMCSGYPPFYSADPMRLYEKIVSGKFQYATHFSNDLKDLIKNILQVDLSRRYGNLKNGVSDIKRHPWYKNINWKAVYEKQIEPPYKPSCKSAADASNFDTYDEEVLRVDSVDKFEKEFAEF